MTDLPDNLSAQEATALLAQKVQAFHDALAEAQKVADKYGMTFRIEPAYGMGGTYYGKTHSARNPDSDDGYYSSDIEYQDGWLSSSASC